MDVFSVRDQLVADYREFTGSFVTIHDERVRDHVARRNASDYQSPDPWLSLNPNFAPGGSITELVGQGVLDPECEDIFRIKPEPADSDGPVLRLHRLATYPLLGDAIHAELPLKQVWVLAEESG